MATNLRTKPIIMTTIKIKLGILFMGKNNETVTIEDLDKSEEDWGRMTQEEKLDAIQEWVDGLDQPCLTVESWKEK